MKNEKICIIWSKYNGKSIQYQTVYMYKPLTRRMVQFWTWVYKINPSCCWEWTSSVRNYAPTRSVSSRTSLWFRTKVWNKLRVSRLKFLFSSFSFKTSIFEFKPFLDICYDEKMTTLQIWRVLSSGVNFDSNLAKTFIQRLGVRKFQTNESSHSRFLRLVRELRFLALS